MKEYKLEKQIKELAEAGRMEAAREAAAESMSRMPDSPIPHNLLGIILEEQGLHVDAMKHFRAANALDPAYLPARRNMEHYGSFFRKGKCFYTEEECCTGPEPELYKTEYDERGVGHIVRRKSHVK